MKNSLTHSSTYSSMVLTKPKIPPRDSPPPKRKSEVGYSARHWRQVRALGSAVPPCHDCGTNDPTKRYEWSQLHSRSGYDSSDYVVRCKSCHHRYDIVSYLKLSLDQMSEIRERYDNGESMRSLAREFKVQRAHISHYVFDLKKRATPEMIAAIYEARDGGRSWRSIAREIGVTHNTPQSWIRKFEAMSEEELDAWIEEHSP